MSIQRYTTINASDALARCDTGRWVTYDDHAAALKQARREALEEARDTVCMACRYKAPMEGRTYHQPYEMSAVQEFCLAFAIRALLDASEAAEKRDGA